MCRAIKTLHNFSPPATVDKIRASSLQFVRKLSGFAKPSKANEAALNRAVDDVAHEVGGAFSLFQGHIIGRNVELVPNGESCKPGGW